MRDAEYSHTEKDMGFVGTEGGWVRRLNLEMMHMWKKNERLDCLHYEFI